MFLNLSNLYPISCVWEQFCHSIFKNVKSDESLTGIVQIGSCVCMDEMCVDVKNHTKLMNWRFYFFTKLSSCLGDLQLVQVGGCVCVVDEFGASTGFNTQKKNKKKICKIDLENKIRWANNVHINPSPECHSLQISEGRFVTCLGWWEYLSK